MNVFVTGGTGFVGSALVDALARGGHDVAVLTRNSNKAARDGVRFVGAAQLDTEVARSDVVVNLAGEPIGQRWTNAVKRRLRTSRIDTTQQLVAAMAQAQTPPRVFVSASAVGYYGDAGERRLTESSESGSDFLATVCRDWEAAALPAQNLGVRVVIPRIGLVLGRGGGVLGKMALPLKMGVAPQLGRPDDFFPWVSLDDLVAFIVDAINDPSYQGIYNAVAPDEVRWRGFTQALQKAGGAPIAPPVPAFALKLGLGEASSSMLVSQRVVPQRLTEHGFDFQKTTLAGALEAAL